MQTLMRALPATAELTIGSLLVMLFVAIPLGSLSALYRGSWIDQGAVSCLFWVQLCPASGWD